MIHKSEDQEAKNPDVLAYNTPHLRVYGDIRVLTAAGSTIMAETTDPMGKKSMGMP